MSSLPYVYLAGLKTWLDARLLADPPPDPVPADGHICVGRYQASPTDYTWIVSLNQNDPEEVGGSDANWRHEVVDGDQAIMGGCISVQWHYRYTLAVTYNMTISNDTQIEAFEKGTALLQWLRRQVNMATTSALSLTTTPTGETALGQQVKRITQRELGGPPSSYIAIGKLYVEQLVFVE